MMSNKMLMPQKQVLQVQKPRHLGWQANLQGHPLPVLSQSKTATSILRKPRGREKEGVCTCQALSRREQLLGGGAALAGSVFGCGCPACAGISQASSQQPSLYQRYFAYAMASSMGVYESAAHPWKTDLFSKLFSFQGRPTQRVLEVGVGTGPNFKYLAAAHKEQQKQLSAQSMLDHGQLPSMAAVDAGLNGSVSLLQGRAEELPLESESFDAAVITLVLCSVQDPARAVDEVIRVLKPQGKLLFLEHVAASWETQPLIRAEQALLNPLQSALADNCHLTRDTKRVIEAKGSNFSDLVLIEENLPGVGVFSPHIRGIAVK
ncbi:S-adenosyl-L-methionine-dependent methyltransferase [Dunaliella salina]|uniref:S-adenosyl-L-methionine-dependent methyltransferase n=1 Tax=Dunaliella salina TaxID=3046 RepID=A0ABQ7GI09_DUNSA|nr:S-adenosyl-L-methionine-dependent methyltransferase [Dunaliella salina]|eukprot:KAF5834251.1 S-adenosyl-L-methionine-dependent methyltransferase [Dunaliella salina]